MSDKQKQQRKEEQNVRKRDLEKVLEFFYTHIPVPNILKNVQNHIRC